MRSYGQGRYQQCSSTLRADHSEAGCLHFWSHPHPMAQNEGRDLAVAPHRRQEVTPCSCSCHWRDSCCYNRSTTCVHAQPFRCSRLGLCIMLSFTWTPQSVDSNTYNGGGSDAQLYNSEWPIQCNSYTHTHAYTHTKGNLLVTHCKQQDVAAARCHNTVELKPSRHSNKCCAIGWCIAYSNSCLFDDAWCPLRVSQ